jgi:hypothetical protein
MSTRAISKRLPQTTRSREQFGGETRLFAECGNPVRQPRHLSPGRVAVHDIFLRRTNDDRLGFSHGGERDRSIAGSDCFLDLTDHTAQTSAARPIDRRAAFSLASGLLCGLCISHDACANASCARVLRRGAYRGAQPSRQRSDIAISGRMDHDAVGSDCPYERISS